jgi:DNA-binding GntR family transcriptional regulator
MLLDSPVERPRFSDIAYRRLRDAIITGELAPGEKLRDGDLATRLGLSRTPVREALSRLTDAGLVEAKPGVHTRVTTLNRHDVETTLSVLQVLDELAVRTAVPLMTKDDLDQMRAANQEFERGVQALDVDAALTADDHFHGVVFAAARNPVLTRVVELIHPQVHRIVHRKFSTLLGGRDTIDHHALLIKLCEAGDAEKAAQVSADHWRHLGGLIGELFDTDALEA